MGELFMKEKTLKEKIEDSNFAKYGENDILEKILMRIVEDKGVKTKHIIAIKRYKENLLKHYDDLGLFEYINELIEKSEEKGHDIYKAEDYDIIMLMVKNKCDKIKKLKEYYKLQVWEQVVGHLEMLFGRAYEEEIIELKTMKGVEYEEKAKIFTKLNEAKEKVWRTYFVGIQPLKTYDLLERWVSTNRKLYSRVLNIVYEDESQGIGWQKEEKINELIAFMEKTLDDTETNIVQYLRDINYDPKVTEIRREFSALCWSGKFALPSRKIQAEVTSLCSKINEMKKERLYDEFKKEVIKCAKDNWLYLKAEGITTGETLEFLEPYTKEITDQFDIIMRCVFLKEYINDLKDSSGVETRINQCERELINAIIETCPNPELKKEFNENKSYLSIRLYPKVYYSLRDLKSLKKREI